MRVRESGFRSAVMEKMECAVESIEKETYSCEG